MEPLNYIGRQLADGLSAVRYRRDIRDQEKAELQKVSIVGAGGALTAAYEHLRIAAENTEEHLLLQSAIKRFYKQIFITRDRKLIDNSGHELAVELTLAGYLQNDTLTQGQIEEVSGLAARYYDVYEQLLKDRAVSNDAVERWAVDVLSVEVEALLNDHAENDVFAQLAYDYFSANLPLSDIASKQPEGDGTAALMVAVYRALLKSNNATVRAMLLKRYGVTLDSLERFTAFNQTIDTLLSSKNTEKLYRIVVRQGAPLRILYRMINDTPDIQKVLDNREQFLDQYEKQVEVEYSQVSSWLNKAIVRSVLFLIITKFLIGICIEIPYDYWAHGHIKWTPLLVNFLFPPLYMILLRSTLHLPGYANTAALVDRIDAILYKDSESSIQSLRADDRKYSKTFSAVYALLGVIVFALVVWLLLMLDFSFVHIGIFFIFISAASFLGFTLSRHIREIEVFTTHQNGLTIIRDLIYLPFVVVGRWMSEKYSQINIVTLLLDMIIELPMKTVLRLMRQWSAFIDDRKDTL